MKNTLWIKTAIIISALLTCTTLPVQAAENGVAYINFERLYQESKIVQEVRDTINKSFSDREGGLREQSEDLQTMQETLEKEALTLGKSELEKKRVDIQQLERDFVRDRRALVEDRGVIMQERRRLIDIEIAKIIEKIAEERKYSMVINPFLTLPVSGNRTLTHNIILFADGTADITADVIARFDGEVDANLFIK
ncbi:MAG: OmpH family outer membrane protein [Gammaproteobacteria bacterium WSBS_2016_MAG_OTU1]